MINLLQLFIICLISCSAALLTYELAKLPAFGVIRASASLTILAFALFKLASFWLVLDVDFLTAAFFGGTFVGMSSPAKYGRFSMLICAILFSLLFLFLLPLLDGIGGALGLSAFLSICLWTLLKRIKGWFLLHKASK